MKFISCLSNFCDYMELFGPQCRKIRFIRRLAAWAAKAELTAVCMARGLITHSTALSLMRLTGRAAKTIPSVIAHRCTMFALTLVLTTLPR